MDSTENDGRGIVSRRADLEATPTRWLGFPVRIDESVPDGTIRFEYVNGLGHRVIEDFPIDPPSA